MLNRQGPVLSVVRARAAVAGMPPVSPQAMFARPSPRTSLRLSCLVLVSPSAMRAEISVSKIEIAAIEIAGNKYEICMAKEGI